MAKTKMTSSPPRIEQQVEAVKEFISRAESHKIDNSTHIEEKKNLFPWEEEHVRKDLKKGVTINLSEEYAIKVKYISELTRISQQKILRDIIYKNIDEMISKEQDNNK